MKLNDISTIYTNSANIADKKVFDLATEVVLEFYKLDKEEVFAKSTDSKSKLPSKVMARQIIAWIVRNYTSMSLTTFGYYLGNRDHATIVHAIKTINNERSTNKRLHRETTVLLNKVDNIVRGKNFDNPYNILDKYKQGYLDETSTLLALDSLDTIEETNHKDTKLYNTRIALSNSPTNTTISEIVTKSETNLLRIREFIDLLNSDRTILQDKNIFLLRFTNNIYELI
jgi:hypothetical protein